MKNYIKVDSLTGLNSTAMTTSYQSINSPGFDGPAILLRIINDTDKSIDISYDGKADNDYLPKGATLQIDLQANAAPNGNMAMFRKGTQVWVKGDKGTGYIYVTTYYLEA
jgi:hypothetical protein